MNRTLNSLRLFLFTCSGEDNYILKRCKSGIQKRFALIGFFVLLIFVGCFFSATLFSYCLFQGAKWTSIPIGILWGAMVVNMYLLLLHTISPAIIPLASKKKKKNNNIETNEKVNVLNLSMLLRVGFMMLLAIIIAQPLNYSTLSYSIQTNLEKHKIQERVKLYTLTNKHLIEREFEVQKNFIDNIQNKLNSSEAQQVYDYLEDINLKIISDKNFITISTKKLKELNLIDNNVFLNQIENRKKSLIINQIEILLENQLNTDEAFSILLNEKTISGNIKVEFNDYKNTLVNLVDKKIKNYNDLNILLNRSNFYIKTIQLLLIENPVSWLITVAICLLFLLPIIFKFKARNISAKLFLENQKHNPELIKLRQELINTTDFNWLEKKIKSSNVKEIRTSDYYFQRMLIEHKIILEEYEQAKELFSKTLTSNIRLYNRNSLTRLLPLLEKIKKTDNSKYQDLSTQIIKEYKDEIVIKYEYWLDCPFRTKRVQNIIIKNNEVGLLDFVYKKSEEEN